MSRHDMVYNHRLVKIERNGKNSMRKKIVAGNWKMNALRYEAQSLLNAISEASNKIKQAEIVVLPSFVHLQMAEECLSNSLVAWGAQNFYIGEAGAYTGEVSGPMLVDYGCHYVLVGHSERRTLFHEDLLLVAEKFKSALQYGLHPILCVGETRVQREQGQTEEVIREQLASVIQGMNIQLFRQAIIAYEPIWAIGTGMNAMPEEAQAVHRFIRQYLMHYDVEVGQTVRILYGGSVKPDNAGALFAMPDIDGGLIGGASLNAESFLEICRAVPV